MTATTAMRRRGHDTWLARRYTTLAAELAAARRYSDALACQVMADSHRVSSILWSRASVSHDAVSTFFDLASQVMGTVVDITPRSTTSPADTLAATRAAFESALEDFNLPVNFSPPAWVDRVPEQMDPLEWSRAVLGDLTWQEYVESMLARGAQMPVPQRPAYAIMAYLVQIAGASGDVTMMSATARWLLISSEADPDGGVSLLDAARKVLGPVEWVRMTPLRTLIGA